MFGRAFENHVLDKMGDAVRLRGLVARASFQPDADRGGTDMLHLLGDDGEAVGQNLTTDIADFFYHDDFFMKNVY